MSFHYKSLLLSFVIAITTNANSQVWQWSVAVRDARENNGTSRAYLWIPENCKKVRGVILAQNNMEELSILQNTKFRKSMSDLGFAEVWVAPSFDHLFLFNKGAGETFNGMMNDLAGSSGYGELKNAPVVGIGHSAAASWPYYFGAWNSGRTLACISVSGQWPYFRSDMFAPDIWSKEQNIDFIPSLETMGEYEAANIWSAGGLKERKEHPLTPLSMLACPAEGHFAATQKKIDYIAFYIKKAAQYRLAKEGTATQPPVLKSINPTTTGWLKDKWRLNKFPAYVSAPVALYKGNADEAFWFFDEETIRVTEKYEASYRNMKAQLLGYVQEGKVAHQKNSHLQVDLKFLPKDDDVTFQLEGTFLDTVPGESPRPKDWTGLQVGSKIGHVKTNTPVSIDVVIGPVVKVGQNLFKLQLQKGYGGQKGLNATFVATHPGDDEYKPAVQQAQMSIPRNTEGAEQHISFRSIAQQTTKTKKLKLAATSDAGLPVYFYIKEGPAEIDGSTLTFSKIPARSKYPVRVTVVAWQWGRRASLKIKTAESVEQTFYISKR